MNYTGSTTYLNEIKQIAAALSVSSGRVLVTGASGLIGSCMIDVMLAANKEFGANFEIYALGRSLSKLEERFTPHKTGSLKLIEGDITSPLDESIEYDYIIHAASNADPKTYAVYPVETVLTNVKGAENVLNYCKSVPGARVLLASTFEVYGKHEADEYVETDFGSIDPNSVRSGYPESKRVAELLFRSYHEEYNVDAVIARLSSIYGPTMKPDDSKAHAQFIRNGLNGEDIVLKSEGLQKRTYCYVMDAVSGMFKVLFDGVSGEAYNVANSASVATIAEVAKTVADLCETKVVFDLPDDIERKGFSKPQNCVLVTDKLKDLGWSGRYSLYEGLKSTLTVLTQAEKSPASKRSLKS